MASIIFLKDKSAKIVIQDIYYLRDLFNTGVMATVNEEGTNRVIVINRDHIVSMENYTLERNQIEEGYPASSISPEELDPYDN